MIETTKKNNIDIEIQLLSKTIGRDYFHHQRQYVSGDIINRDLCIITDSYDTNNNQACKDLRRSAREYCNLIWWQNKFSAISLLGLFAFVPFRTSDRVPDQPSPNYSGFVLNNIDFIIRFVFVIPIFIHAGLLYQLNKKESSYQSQSKDIIEKQLVEFCKDWNKTIGTIEKIEECDTKEKLKTSNKYYVDPKKALIDKFKSCMSVDISGFEIVDNEDDMSISLVDSVIEQINTPQKRNEFINSRAPQSVGLSY